MQSWKLEREVIKSSLQKIFKEVDVVEKEDEENIQRFLQQIEDKAERVFLLDNNIKEAMFTEETSQSIENINKELDDEENLRDEVFKYKNKCQFLMKNINETKIERREEGKPLGKLGRRLNLPKLELKKFDGNVKNWINFWGQFRKIDEDPDLPVEDKFQYLIQSTEEGSPARTLIESFPPSAKNYQNAIHQMKTRFARDEILIEVYVRELLNLVLNQHISTDNKGKTLSILYDKLETQLRALETLGVTSDKYAAMLLPLVESALPHEILKIWERNRASIRVSCDEKVVNELENVIQFLKVEVEAEERIKIVQSSFTELKDTEKNKERYTLKTLHTENYKTQGKQKIKQSGCIFCENDSHTSQDCIRAQKMSLDQKKVIIARRRGCFSCLKQNHTARTCKSVVKCVKCSRKHHALMCPDLNEKEISKKDDNTQNIENTMTSMASETLLQTINVRIVSENNKSKIVRALVDSGSQRSYITTKCAEEMTLKKIGEENIIQGVFGGIQSTSTIHRLFRADIHNIDESFSMVVSLLEQSKISTQAAPSIEACPPDSVVSEDACKCDPASCRKPPCLSELVLATNGSDLPGQCCPTYSCVGCANETMIDGRCPCAAGAVIVAHKCVCVDLEKSLVDGVCVCNPLQCPLPPLCDKKSVAVSVTDDCCKRTTCIPCPSDSESTNLEGGELEDHCVCLPCKTDCGNNKTVIIKKHGSGFPGNCCDLYECQKPEETKGCFNGEEFFENGKEWLTPDSQVCKCNNGLSLCSKPKEKEAQSCFMDNKLYHDSESWTREDGCTECVCKDGVEQCISHFCDVKESHIQKNHSCFKNDHIYQHTESWTEVDGCTKCTCINGDESCSDNLCEQTTLKPGDCQPLSNCNKTCMNGFKINKKGCEICKCNVVRLGQDILSKYNISLNELIKVLDDYKNKRTSTPSIPSTTTSTSSTTTTKSVVEVTSTTRPVVIINRGNFFEDVSSTTPEPVVVPADAGREPWVYIAIPVLAGGIFIFVIAIMCVYKSKRNSSIDLTNCHYQTVNNNNTIKKTEPLL